MNTSTERNLLGVVYDNTMEVPTSLPLIGYDPSTWQPIYGDKRVLEKNVYYRCVRDVR